MAAGGGGVTPAALTRVSDTNVTLTLGGTPNTALLQATSITVGWSGTLAASRGGFGADVSAQNGVPLFAAGVPTFTGTTGTGNFARINNPVFTGDPQAPTPLTTDNDTSIATTAFVKAAIAAGGGGGVSSIAGNTGAFTLGMGLTNLVNDLRVSLPSLVSYLTTPVNFTSGTTWFDGPSVAQGTVGTFLVIARASCTDSAAASPFAARITDGTNVYDTSSYFYSLVAGSFIDKIMVAIVASPAGNLKLQAQIARSATTGQLTANVQGVTAPRDTFIMAIRIAP